MKQPPRFAISPESAGSTERTVRVTGRELHHMRNVIRLSPGAEVMLYGVDGLQCSGRIAHFEPGAAIIKIAAEPHRQEPGRPRLILAAGLIKAARMDLLIEKAAELNAAEFWPLRCCRSVMREPSSDRQERWRRISLAAAKQSLRSRPMTLQPPAHVAAMAAKVGKAGIAVMCIAGAEPLGSVIRRLAQGPESSSAVVLAVGPEGDFIDEEIRAMSEAGFVAAGVGINRLRSETAALAALSIASGIFAEMDS